MPNRRPSRGSVNTPYQQNSLAGVIAALTSDNIANASAVSGITVSDALDALETLIGALTSTDIANQSAWSGPTVTDALTTINIYLAALSSDDVANNSGVSGTTVSDAINTLAALFPLTATNIDPIDAANGLQLGQRLTAIHAFAAPGAGAQDITLYNANLPFKMRYISSTLLSTTAGAGGSTGTIRTAAGGLGVQLSTAMPTSSTATRAPDGSGGIVLANHTLAAGASLFLRLTDGTAAGTLYIDFLRID